MRVRWWIPTALLGLSALPLQAEAPALPEPHPDLPDAFRQLLPRGEIPAVDDPTFVTAGEAQLPHDAWVLGIELHGRAHAYSLNLLNAHEIVNDSIGETNFAAVW